MNQKREIMNIEDYREYCLSVKGATECMPFDKHTFVSRLWIKCSALQRYALRTEDSGQI